MASLTIRKLDDTVKAYLRLRSAHHGRSVEEEVRVLRADPAPTALPVQGVVELQESSGTEQQRYADVIDAATAEATAMINISYTDVQAAIDTVLAGALIPQPITRSRSQFALGDAG